MSAANITMPYDEFQTIQASITRMTDQISTLQKELTEAKTADPKFAELSKLVRDSVEIITFATANLSPEIVKKWPWQALTRVAMALEHLPDYSAQDVELARELIKIAKECEVWERKRSVEPERFVPPPPPTGPLSGGFGYRPATAHPLAVEAANLARSMDPNPASLPLMPGAQLPALPAELAISMFADRCQTVGSNGIECKYKAGHVGPCVERRSDMICTCHDDPNFEASELRGTARDIAKRGSFHIETCPEYSQATDA
jgi:hypothetical protein